MNEIRTFLQEGINKDKEMDVIYRRLKVKSEAWGFPLMMNNTAGYKLHTKRNPFYPKSAKFSPQNKTNI